MKNQLKTMKTTLNPTEQDIEFGPAEPAFAEETPTEPKNFSEQRAAYIIEDIKGCNWYAKKIALFEWEIATLKAQTAERIKQIEADRARLENFYKAQFESVIFAEAEKRRRKTVTLDFASVSIRTVPAHAKVSNEEEAMKHALQLEAEAQAKGERHGFILPRPDVLYTMAYQTYAQRLAEAGESLPPGTEWIPTRESVSIKTAQKKGHEQDADTIEQDKARA
jgi:hypothetical protein